MKAKVKIHDSFVITGRGPVLSCEMLSGTIDVKDEILLGDRIYTIIGIESFYSGSLRMNTNIGLVLRCPEEERKDFNNDVFALKGYDAEIS